MVYDALACSAILMAAFTIIFVLSLALFGEQAVVEDHLLWGSWVVRLLLLLVLYAYFDVSWRRGGQTLGMRAWRLHVLNSDGSAIDGRQSLVRFISALAGLGTLVAVLHPQNKALQDVLSNSQVYLRAKPNKKT